MMPSYSPVRHWTDLHHLILQRINTKKQKTWALLLRLGGLHGGLCHASVGGTSVCQDVQNLLTSPWEHQVEVFDILIQTHLLKGWLYG